jgi:hypothetical protein
LRRLPVRWTLTLGACSGAREWKDILDKGSRV